MGAAEIKASERYTGVFGSYRHLNRELKKASFSEFFKIVWLDTFSAHNKDRSTNGFSIGAIIAENQRNINPNLDPDLFRKVKERANLMSAFLGIVPEDYENGLFWGGLFNVGRLLKNVVRLIIEFPVVLIDYAIQKFLTYLERDLTKEFHISQIPRLFVLNVARIVHVCVKATSMIVRSLTSHDKLWSEADAMDNQYNAGANQWMKKTLGVGMLGSGARLLSLATCFVTIFVPLLTLVSFGGPMFAGLAAGMITPLRFAGTSRYANPPPKALDGDGVSVENNIKFPEKRAYDMIPSNIDSSEIPRPNPIEVNDAHEEEVAGKAFAAKNREGRVSRLCCAFWKTGGTTSPKPQERYLDQNWPAAVPPYNL